MDTTSVKLRTLIIMKILLQKTDEEHVLNAAGLAKELEKYDMTIDRKTVYKDIEILRDFGLDVQQNKGTAGGYFIGSREFELAELKLLVDAVQSSRFITSKKSEELIRKLGMLASQYEARQLQRDIYIYHRVKAASENIYYTVDDIYNAMFQNKQISFQYAEWNAQKKLVPRYDGLEYQVSPWALTWNNENYYLIGYFHATESILHFRVDKIQKIQILEESREAKELFQDFDLAVFAKKTFGMFQGTDEKVTFSCDRGNIGILLDRFGTDCMVIPVDDDRVHVSTTVNISPQFFGWIAGLGSKVSIHSPEHIRTQYKEYLKEIIENYE